MTDKTTTRIILRGKLDSLNAQIIYLQSGSNNPEFIADLEQVREIVRSLQACEARDEIFDGRLTLFGLDEDEIHKRSHNPKNFYGIGHILPAHEMGRPAASINLLRTLVREIELISCKTFINDELRINHVLNRLSSALYIMTYKYLPEGYNKTISFTKSKEGK
ncbi:MAG: hypothetical protein IJT21_03245 [Synergistaceae bacterium]|nr:hypothetical protein [Synergistaceae bacterium]